MKRGAKRRRKRKKSREKEEANEKKQKPMAQASIYLKGLACDITEACRCEILAQKSTKLPPVLKSKFENMFKDQVAEMKKQRQGIGEALAKETVSAQMIVVAQSKINAFKTDKDSFTKSADVYAKGKGNKGNKS